MDNLPAAADNRRDTERRYRKRRRLLLARGGSTSYVDAAPTIAHVRRLMDAGCSTTSIGHCSGISHRTISLIARGERTRLNRRTAGSLLRVTLQDVLLDMDAPTMVPSVGTIRRIQALLALGWRHEDIHARSGQQTYVLTYRSPRTVTRAVHDAIARVYEELSMTIGPSSMTRARSHAAGYRPPLAWDDIDDPDETPSETRAIGAEQWGTDLDDVEILVADGFTLDQIADRLGKTVDAVTKACTRGGRPDLLSRAKASLRARRAGVA